MVEGEAPTEELSVGQPGEGAGRMLDEIALAGGAALDFGAGASVITGKEGACDDGDEGSQSWDGGEEPHGV